MNELIHYQANYDAARTYFRELATHNGWELHSLTVNESEELFIDIAIWRGGSDKLVIHSSGVHGVEAFPGSAVQCAFLSSWKPNVSVLPSIALIHCVNPFGMRYLRRWNAQNVDLNRNFLSSFTTLPENPLYDHLSPFLNPQSDTQLSFFTLRALKLLAKYRFATLQQATAQGQYNRPTGLFFGGKQPTTENSLLRSFFQQHLREYRVIRGIDFHTGLGKFGQSSFYLEPHFGQRSYQQAEFIFNQTIISALSQSNQSYQMQGSLVAGLKLHCSESDFWMATQEIGTVGPLKILQVLRQENFKFHYQPERHMRSSILLRKVFSPDSDAWKKAAVQAGLRALTQLIHA